MNIIVVIKLHELIKAGQTGNPNNLANKLGLSERSVLYYISFMKREMNAPIVYLSFKRSYVYEEECNFCFNNRIVVK